METAEKMQVKGNFVSQTDVLCLHFRDVLFQFFLALLG